LLTNLDGLATLRADGGTASDGQAGTDAPAADEASDVQAATDAGGGDGAIDASWCSQQADVDYCNDFDEPGSLVWSRTLVDDGGVVALDDATAASASNSLRAQIRAPQGSRCAYARVYRDFPATVTSKVHLERELRLGHVADFGGIPNPFYVALGKVNHDTPTECSFYLSLGAPGQRTNLVVEGPQLDGGELSTTLARGFNPGEWTRVSMDIGPGSEGLMLTMNIGADVVLDQWPVPGCSAGPWSVSAGVLCVPPGQEAELRVDNLLLRLE
jgi:hypothetical protein